MKAKKRKNKDAQEETRFRVALYLRKKLGTQKQASEVFGITERSVNKIWAQYKQGGKSALYSKKRGAQGGKKLKKDQAYKVRQLIKEKLPEQLKLPFGLWTREAVQQLILNKFDIELSRWQVGRYFKNLGIHTTETYKKSL